MTKQLKNKHTPIKTKKSQCKLLAPFPLKRSCVMRSWPSITLRMRFGVLLYRKVISTASTVSEEILAVAAFSASNIRSHSTIHPPCGSPLKPRPLLSRIPDHGTACCHSAVVAAAQPLLLSILNTDMTIDCSLVFITLVALNSSLWDSVVNAVSPVTDCRYLNISINH